MADGRDPVHQGLYPDSNRFLDNIVSYNSCFSMTSFGVSGSYSEDWSTYKIQGQIYHKIGSLLPLPEAEPRFLQVYFMGDSDLQVDHRCNIVRPIFDGVQRTVIGSFQELLDTNNILIQRFKTALDRMPSDSHRIVIRGDRTPAGQHERCYNAPTEDDVAILMVDNEESSLRDIVIQRRDSRLQRINETHPSYDALQYPLIFWRGQDSYHIHLKEVDPATGQPKSKSLSSMHFYAYHLMIREDHQNFILKCRKLLSKFAVDMYAKVEAERLLWCRLHQRQLRVDDYAHLRDAIAIDGNAADVGQPHIILPSTFIGGPRHMAEYSQDGMALIRTFGRPCLFITFTCNPKWPEILELLLPGQKPQHRHDVVARVFKQKLSKLIDVIIKHKLMGPVRGHMYTIEWQKRGLPHAHILIWFQSRIRPEQIDDIISAELPDERLDPILHKIVLKHLVHGPCGHAYPRSPCMQDNRCSKKYPRAFIPETQSDHDGYPLYRRRKPEDGGHIGYCKRNKQMVEIDNRWIVPFSPILTRMFDCHINVEYCHSVRCVKYICKYINKGSDRAIFEVQSANRNDEIAQYHHGRYISSNEAFFRLFHFNIHDRSPAVIHLAVHLENGHRVYYRADRPEAAVENVKLTTLTAFFKLCETDANARNLLYLEIPKYYKWVKNDWVPRQRGESDIVARMYTVHPKNRECFYLRLLLTKVRGPMSFEDLRSFNGIVCETYHAACLQRGLLESDSEWNDCLAEAVGNRTASQIRSLFAMIVCHCNPSQPEALWDRFKRDMSEDLLHIQQRMNPELSLDFTEAIFNQALILIEDDCLLMASKCLTQLGLPAPDRNFLDPMNAEILRETNHDREALTNEISTNLPHLVDDQRVVFNAVADAIEREQGGLFFLDAPGGTGKTFVLNLILAHVRSQGKIILACASSGIASILLSQGRTAHSTLNIPLKLKPSSVCNIRRGSPKAGMLRECKAIVWDECTMTHKFALEAVDRTLRDVLQNDRPFGGIVMILSGDFRQTLPVIPRSTPADEINACLKMSRLWQDVQKFQLSTNMRVHLRGEVGAQDFAQKLLSIGDGTYPINQGLSTIKLTPDFCCLVPNLENLILRVFPDLQDNVGNLNWLLERAILAPTNETVNEINSSVLERVTGVETREYYSVDKALDEESALEFPTELLNSQNPPNFPAHVITLKVGSPIMLLRNFRPPKLCNGTRLCVKRLFNFTIEAYIMSGPFKGEIVSIPRFKMQTDEDDSIKFERLQFPVRLAYAMTINKSQGQSLKVAGLKLDSPPCFSHGQLYVACSRVGSPSNLFILAPDGLTKNVVYRQALR